MGSFCPKHKGEFQIMMDSYAEQLVIRPPYSADRAKRLLTIGGGVAIALLFLILSYVFLPAFLFLAAGAGFGTWWLVSNQYVEYEYLFTNGELDVDKIIGKRKRLRLLTVQVRAITAFCTEEDAAEEPDDCTTILAEGAGLVSYCADFKSDEIGAARLIFSPDERMLTTMQPFLRASAKPKLSLTD